MQEDMSLHPTLKVLFQNTMLQNGTTSIQILAYTMPHFEMVISSKGGWIEIKSVLKNRVKKRTNEGPFLNNATQI